MAIVGVHTLLYSAEPAALREVLGDILGLGHVDDGQDAGWLIFRLPPAEMGVHPADRAAHEITFMCDDLEATVGELEAKGVEFVGDAVDEGWGIVRTMRLPGPVDVVLYQPRHPTAL